MHKGMTYPDMAQPAAFICNGMACSAPIFKAEDIAPRLDHLLNAAKTVK